MTTLFKHKLFYHRYHGCHESFGFLVNRDTFLSQTNYVLSWTKQDGRLPNTAIDQNGVLMISDIKEGEAGSYICTGSDQRGVDTATLIIRIES